MKRSRPSGEFVVQTIKRKVQSPEIDIERVESHRYSRHRHNRNQIDSGVKVMMGGDRP